MRTSHLRMIREAKAEAEREPDNAPNRRVEDDRGSHGPRLQDQLWRLAAAQQHRYGLRREAAPSEILEPVTSNGHRRYRRSASTIGRILTRLSRSKVGAWMLGYFAFSWLVLQLGDVLSEAWNWPLLLQKSISLALGLGVLPALVVAWFHGERGRQDVCAVEVVLLAGTLLLTAAVLWRFYVAVV